MNIKDIDMLGLSDKSKDQIEVDSTTLVVSDEFEKGIKSGSYRKNAIKKLVSLGIPFHSEYNIMDEMSQAFIKIVCPYCDTCMKTMGTSASRDQHSLHYICPSCKSKIMLQMQSEAISISPPK